MLLRRFMDDRFSPGVGAIKIPISGLIQQYKDAYADLKKKGRRITWKEYRMDPGDYVVVHFKVPSRSVKDVYYDVVVALVPKSTRTTSFLDCHVKFFCNAPSFTYSGTAYLFHSLPDPDLGTGGMEPDRFGNNVPINRITLFESKLPDNAFTTPPTQKNPYNIPMLLDNVVGVALIELTNRIPYWRVMRNQTKITEERLLEDIKSFGEMTMNRTKMANIQKAEKEREANWAKTAEKGVKTTRKGDAPKSNVKKIKAIRSSSHKATKPIKSGNVKRID